jgi:hypothetical protein
MLSTASVWAADAAQEKAAGDKLAFAAAGKEFQFDTGALRGTLRSQGRSLGLMPAFDAESGGKVSGAFGLFSHYRLLDAEARYGHAAWDWASQAKLLPDGSVEAVWSADKEHPFDLKAVYRWKAPNTFDIATSVTARAPLRGRPESGGHIGPPLQRFEVFLASYFDGFEAPFVYVKGCPETGGKPGFVEAKKPSGDWQAFPRDDDAVKLIQDGRWKRPPNPVDWKIMPALAAPLTIRRDAKSGSVAVLMAPAGDCFAISTPYTGEGHRSVYLSLFGRDLKAGETATARSRLVIGRAISDEQAIALYEAYLKEIQGGSEKGK